MIVFRPRFVARRGLSSFGSGEVVLADGRVVDRFFLTVSGVTGKLTRTNVVQEDVAPHIETPVVDAAEIEAKAEDDYAGSESVG